MVSAEPLSPNWTVLVNISVNLLSNVDILFELGNICSNV